MDIRPAKFIRTVNPAEKLAEVVDEAKSLTWTRRCEIALLFVLPDELCLVSGGYDGIAFRIDDVLVTMDGSDRVVRSLAWHTHPRATGPSDHDRAFLQALGQRSSVIYEMFAHSDGTRFWPKENKP